MSKKKPTTDSHVRGGSAVAHNGGDTSHSPSSAHQSSPIGGSDDYLSIKERIERQRLDGYRVMPSSLLSGTATYNSIYLNDDILNFASLSPHGSPYQAAFEQAGNCGCSPSDHRGITNTAFIATSGEVKEPSCGDPELGWIPWGGDNMLPNFISLANSMLPYTAEAIEFNTKVAVGLGLTPVYNHPAITNDDGQPLPYQAAGSRIKARIFDLQKQIYDLVKDHQQAPATDTDGQSDSPDGGASASSPSATVSGGSAVAPIIRPAFPQPTPAVDPDNDDDIDGGDSSPSPSKSNKRPEGYFRRIADDILDDTIRQAQEEISELKRDYSIWRRTKRQLDEFLAQSDTVAILQPAAADRVSYGLCYHTINLNIANRHNERQLNGQWQPRIVSIGHIPAQKCRKERHDIEGISRHIYISNKWLNPQEQNIDKDNGKDITALPAIDPQHPYTDLKARIERFRSTEQRDHDKRQEQAGDEPVFDDITRRPTRFIYPAGQYTPGRTYYPLPAYWSIYNDVYQYAATIIRDRAIRKANENMFGRIIYVHAEYLERLTNQLDAQETEEARMKKKEEEIKKIQDFLGSKFNNGSTFATCSFIGSDGQSHDAFRVETIPYNTTKEADAARTEIQDISGIILFAFECHPDLIGATPGGASSSGGTYQREMMLLKQALVAPIQQSILAPYRLARDFNEWDHRLDFTIEQRTLTSLDQKHSGWENARK